MPVYINPNAANFFLDTEFFEEKSHDFSLDFFSIGFVDEGGHGVYGVYDQIDEEKYKETWVEKNVLAKLPPQHERESLTEISDKILESLKGTHGKEVHIWAHNGSYDFFNLCRLFGGMIEMRRILKEKASIEKIILRDTKELTMDPDLSYVKQPEQDSATEHISIYDAHQEHDVFTAYKPHVLAMRRGLATNGLVLRF